MNDNVPIASYTELLKRRLNALRTLARSLRESQNALLTGDAAQSGQFSEQQIELCNEIEYLDRDLRSADEILAWAKALKPDNREIVQIRRHTKTAEEQLTQSSMVHSSLVRRAMTANATARAMRRAISPCDSARSNSQAKRVATAVRRRGPAVDFIPARWRARR